MVVYGKKGLHLPAVACNCLWIYWCKRFKKMRKVTHNQLVDSYGHMSQRGFLLARAEKSITWVIIDKHYDRVSKTMAVSYFVYYLFMPPNTHSAEYRYLFWVFSSLNFSLACPTNISKSFDLPLWNCTRGNAFVHVSATRNLFTVCLFSLLFPNVCLLISNTLVKLAKIPINISFSVR